MRICQVQKPAGLRQTVAGLHQDRFSNSTLLQYGLKLRRQIVAIKNSKVRAHPRIVEQAQLPEMLMGVNDAVGHKTKAIFHFSFVIHSRIHFGSATGMLESLSARFSLTPGFSQVATPGD